MKGKIALALAALIAGGGMFGPTEPAAAETLVTHRIPAALALEAVGEAVAACAKQGYAETAVLVDADGVRQALLRGDGTGVHSLDSAFSKAYTSATLKANTLVVIERTKEDPMMVPSIAKLPNIDSQRRRRGDQDQGRSHRGDRRRRRTRGRTRRGLRESRPRQDPQPLEPVTEPASRSISSIIARPLRLNALSDTK